MGSATDAGAVNVIYGSARALSRRQPGSSARTISAAASRRRAATGSARRSTGDFDADGFADLAVGAPGEDLGPAADAGAVDVLYGSPAGLRRAAHQVLSQGGGGIEDSAAAGDRFGAALAAGRPERRR